MRVIGKGALCAVAPAALVLSLGTAARSASADEPVAASEPRLLSETAEITSVVDAFDEGDIFDLNLTLGFIQSFKHADIRRETDLFQPGLSTGGFTPHSENVASYSQSTSTLMLGADIGIFRDLALIVRLPIILSDSASLGDLNGSSANPQRLQDYNGAQLFTVPFKGPTRSGVDWFSTGLDYAIFNQQRDSTKPTWVLGVEGRWGVGTPLHACNANGVIVSDGTTRTCPDPANPTGANRTPGISRAMITVQGHTVFSRRFGYVEPYTGFWVQADFPESKSSSDYSATDSFSGEIINHPPVLGTFAMGMEVIPWERRDQFQRFVADFRLLGTYHSPGRDYSELFDALGSSQAASLRNPNPGRYMNGVPDPTAQNDYFTGITDELGYSSLGGRVQATIQAGQYLKFNAGVGFTYNQSHLVTSAEPCNPFASVNDIGQAGNCTSNNGTVSTGLPNPNYRDAIDSPGRRFSVDNGTIVDLWINGVVMF
jgi:hypothetical protein